MSRFEKAFLGVGIEIIELVLQGYFRHLQLGVENKGISFGLLERYASWGTTATILILILRYKNRILDDLGWWLVAVGGISNTLSRLLSGFVFDYVPFGQYLCQFGGFICSSEKTYLWINGADIMISVGACLLIVDIIRNYLYGKRSNTVGK